MTVFGQYNGVFPCRRPGLEWGLVRFGHRAVFGQQEGVFPCGGPGSRAGGPVFGQRDRVFPGRGAVLGRWGGPPAGATTSGC